MDEEKEYQPDPKLIEWLEQNISLDIKPSWESWGFWITLKLAGKSISSEWVDGPNRGNYDRD